MKTIRVGVAGLGFVGRETVRLLAKNRSRFHPLGVDLALAAVCDRNVALEARALGLKSQIKRYNNPDRFFKEAELDIIVELLGGLEAPRKLVFSALNRGLGVVTANKLLVSHEWKNLDKFWRNGRLAFEASVAGAIPILQALEQGLAADRITSLHGILNGTSNYILSRVEEGLSPEQALAEAQKLGFAEKDPSFDLNGTDTAQKLSILSAILTGSALNSASIFREGISRIEAYDISFARNQLRRVPKLLGTLRLQWGNNPRLEAHVFPTLLPLDHPLASVRHEYNAVLVEADPAGNLMFYGKGAGPGPTASAVVGDILRLALRSAGSSPSGPKQAGKISLAAAKDCVSAFYLRLNAADKPGVLARVCKLLAQQDISIASIHQDRQKDQTLVPVVLTTHRTTQGKFSSALKAILKNPAIHPRHSVWRLFNSHDAA